RSLLGDQRVAQVPGDRVHLALRQVAKLDVGSPGADRRRAHCGLRADEELVPVQVRPVLDEGVGIPLPLEGRSARGALELEPTGADDAGLDAGWVAVEILLGKDDVPG